MKRLWVILFLIILGSCDERIEYSLITRVIPSEGGIVNPSSGTYKENAELSVTATHDSTYVFSGWSGSVTSNDNPLSLTMDSDKNLTATFVKNLRLLVLNISGEGLVEKRVDGNLVNDSLFVVGQTIKLTAVPEKDWVFDKWIYPETSINPISVTISKDTTLQVKFMRYFNYKIPSHDWENYSMPWLDLANIVESLNFDKRDSYNTNAAYADFNFDGYQDIMIYSNLADGENVEKWFLTYDSKFYK